MYALDSANNKITWNGNRWNPVYDSVALITKKFINNKVTSYHYDNRFLTNKDFVSDY